MGTLARNTIGAHRAAPHATLCKKIAKYLFGSRCFGTRSRKGTLHGFLTKCYTFSLFQSVWLFVLIQLYSIIYLYPRSLALGRSYSPVYRVPGYPTAVVAPHMPHVFWHFFCTFLLPHLPLRCFFSHFGPLSLHFDPALTKTVGPCMAWLSQQLEAAS